MLFFGSRKNLFSFFRFVRPIREQRKGEERERERKEKKTGLYGTDVAARIFDHSVSRGVSAWCNKWACQFERSIDNFYDILSKERWVI